MKTLKFGGTSVGKPERMQHIAGLITQDPDPKIVVLSALSGTTNALVEIGDNLLGKKVEKAGKLIQELYAHYMSFIDHLYSKEKPAARSL